MVFKCLARGGIASLARQRNLGSRQGRSYVRRREFGMTITANDEGIATKSFAGLRVLDFSTTIAGPHCARMLADMGAEVIKIEQVEGERMRTRPPLRNDCITTFRQLNARNTSLLSLLT